MSMAEQLKKMEIGKGFVAALDQSGGSTPKALKNYGIGEDQFSNDEEMFTLVHKMRERIITSPAFNGDKILGAILFEKTMDDVIQGIPTAKYLWNELEIVPFLKIDKGLEEEDDGVQLMKDIPSLDNLLQRAVTAGIFGTKMRSVIHEGSANGITAVVKQQFDVAKQILSHNLIPIIEPEISIKALDKAVSEQILLEEIYKNLETLDNNQQIMLKLTLPEQSDHYRGLVAHKKVLRVVALSGGYDIDEACKRLANNPGMIASFSRALTNDLRADQSEEEFNQTLQEAIDKIYEASVKDIEQVQAA